MTQITSQISLFVMAERERFEPSKGISPYTLSKVMQSCCSSWIS